MDKRIRCDSPPESVPGPAVEVQIVETDAEQQLEAPADLLQHLAPGVSATSGWLDGPEKRVQLVEIQLTELVDVLVGNREQQPRRTQAGTMAVRADMCSTMTLSSHASMREFASPRCR